MIRPKLLTIVWVLASAAAGCAPRAPLPAADPPAAEVEPVHRLYREVEGRSLAAYVFSPAVPARSPQPAILLFHGGGWVAGSADWTFAAARRFQALGLVAIAIDYRLAGEGVTPIDALADTCAAFAWARRAAEGLGIDPDRVAGYGVSAGGQLVAAAATRGCGNDGGTFANGGPDALVLWSPALDVANDGWFERLLLGRAAAADYSPTHLVSARIAPSSIVQGEEDSLTPAAGTRRFCEQAEALGSRCLVHSYPGLGHLLTRSLQNQEDDFDPDPIARADAIARQEAFLRELWRLPQQ